MAADKKYLSRYLHSNGTTYLLKDAEARKTIEDNERVIAAAIAELSDEASNTVKRTEMGAASGVATLGSDGKVPSAQLPSYVDDVLEYTNKASFPASGETGKIYVDTTTNLTYRWSGTAYVEISQSLALGETASTAYAGDKGKANATAISTHTGNSDIHVTADQKTAWSGKQDAISDLSTIRSNASTGATHAGTAHAPSNAQKNVQSDWNATSGDALILNKPTLFDGNYNSLTNKPTIPTIPASLPADGGNADTVDGKHAADFAEASHTHTKSEITDFIHTHTKSEITDFEHTHSYESLTDKPNIVVQDDLLNTVNINGHLFVDMGLPSGLLWSIYNIGANVEHASGYYYQWGSTTRESLSEAWADRSYDGDVLDLEHDTARQEFEGAWRLPTFDELRELMNNVTYSLVSRNGQLYPYLSSKNISGRCLVFPRSGYYTSGENRSLDSDNKSYIATSTLISGGYVRTFYMRASSAGYGFASVSKTYSMNIRPVITREDAYKYLESKYSSKRINELAESVSNCYTKTESDAKYLTEHQSLADYYTKTESDAKFLTEHQSLSGYYSKDEVNTLISALTSRIQTLEDALNGKTIITQ